MENRLLSVAYDGALRLLREVAGERLPEDFDELFPKILLVLLEPNEKHSHGEALSGYDEDGHNIFIAYYCAVGELPDLASATLALLHELGHIFLGMNEEEVESLMAEVARRLGVDITEDVDERRDLYAKRKHVWDEGRFPYLGVLRNEVRPEEAKAKIREMSERGFDFSV